MKKIDVVISTRNRLEKLQRLMNSIPGRINGVGIYIKVACDGDHNGYLELINNKRISNLIYFPQNRGAVYCRNELIKKCEDAVIPAPDDIEFQTGAFTKAIFMFIEKFKDDDGVIGFNQIGNRKFCKSGVSLVGKNFIERYPQKQLFNPQYFHFAAQEILWAAIELGKFMFCEEAIVKHYNPFIDPSQMDQTHHDARIHRERDHRLSLERQKKGLIWGING